MPSETKRAIRHAYSKGKYQSATPEWRYLTTTDPQVYDLIEHSELVDSKSKVFSLIVCPAPGALKNSVRRPDGDIYFKLDLGQLGADGFPDVSQLKLTAWEVLDQSAVDDGSVAALEKALSDPSTSAPLLRSSNGDPVEFSAASAADWDAQGGQRAPRGGVEKWTYTKRFEAFASYISYLYAVCLSNHHCPSLILVIRPSRAGGRSSIC